jgi:hypothetical protein
LIRRRHRCSWGCSLNAPKLLSNLSLLTAELCFCSLFELALALLLQLALLRLCLDLRCKRFTVLVLFLTLPVFFLALEPLSKLLPFLFKALLLRGLLALAPPLFLSLAALSVLDLLLKRERRLTVEPRLPRLLLGAEPCDQVSSAPERAPTRIRSGKNVVVCGVRESVQTISAAPMLGAP